MAENLVDKPSLPRWWVHDTVLFGVCPGLAEYNKNKFYFACDSTFPQRLNRAMRLKGERVSAGANPMAQGGCNRSVRHRGGVSPQETSMIAYSHNAITEL